MEVIIYTDNPKSWFIPFGEKLKSKIENLGFPCKYIFNKKEIHPCDILFILSCTKIVPLEILEKNKHNIVVHASDLPKGKGFTPMQWQILEGKDSIPLTLFEAVNDIDAGPYYFKRFLKLNGTELLDEIKTKMGILITEMCLNFVQDKRKYKPIEQIGEESFYRRRVVTDDQLDVEKSIREQFNHFRIADNDNYPLYFYMNKKKYILKIHKG